MEAWAELDWPAAEPVLRGNWPAATHFLAVRAASILYKHTAIKLDQAMEAALRSAEGNGRARAFAG